MSEKPLYIIFPKYVAKHRGSYLANRIAKICPLPVDPLILLSSYPLILILLSLSSYPYPLIPILLSLSSYPYPLIPILLILISPFIRFPLFSAFLALAR